MPESCTGVPISRVLPNLVRALQRSGMTQSAIARAVHAPKSAVNRWLNSQKTLSFDHGAQLLWLVSQEAPDTLSADDRLLPRLWSRSPLAVSTYRIVLRDLRARPWP